MFVKQAQRFCLILYDHGAIQIYLLTYLLTSFMRILLRLYFTEFCLQTSRFYFILFFKLGLAFSVFKTFTLRTLLTCYCYGRSMTFSSLRFSKQVECFCFQDAHFTYTIDFLLLPLYILLHYVCNIGLRTFLPLRTSFMCSNSFVFH